MSSVKNKITIEGASIVNEGQIKITLINSQETDSELHTLTDRIVYGRLTWHALYCYDTKKSKLHNFHSKLAIREISKISVPSHKKYISIATKTDGTYNLSTPKDRHLKQWILSLQTQYQKQSEEKCNDLQCAICSKILSNPVKNTRANTYCYECIVKYYKLRIQENNDQKDNEQIDKRIRDPLTNQPLPQNSLLLIPDFSKMIKIYENEKDEPLDELQKRKYKKIDDKLNHYRKKITQPPLNSKTQKKICEIGVNTGMFDTNNLSSIIDDMMDMHRLENKINRLIDENIKTWNKMVGNHPVSKYQWKIPKYGNIVPSLDKTKAGQAIEGYGVDDAVFEGCLYELKIEEFVKVIWNILETTPDRNKAKQEIIRLILVKQEEIVEKYMEEDKQGDNDSQNEEVEEMIVDARNAGNAGNIVTIDDNHRVWYNYKPERKMVGMKCGRKMLDMIGKKEPFELIFEDHSGRMTKEKLIKFLKFGGCNDVKDVWDVIYRQLGQKLKHEILKCASENGGDYWQYDKILEIELIDEPDNIRNKEYDFNWFKLRLDFNFQQEISKFNNNDGYEQAVERMKKMVKKELAAILGILPHYIVINEAKAGSIMLIVGIAGLAVISLLNAGCYSLEVKANTDNRWSNARKSAIAQSVASGAALGISGAAVGFACGGAIGACKVGATIGGVLGLAAGPVGAIIGGVLGGALGSVVFVGALWYAQRKAKKNPQNLIVSDDSTAVPNQSDKSRSRYIIGSNSQSAAIPAGDVNNTENRPLLQKEPSKIKIKEQQFNLNIVSKVESTQKIIKVNNDFPGGNPNFGEQKVSADMVGSFSYKSTQSTYEEPSSAGSAILHWKESISATFIMTTKTQFRSVDENVENDDNENIIVKVKLINCGHEFPVDYAKSGTGYRIKCDKCGEESSVEFVKETGCRNGAQYKMIYT